MVSENPNKLEASPLTRQDRGFVLQETVLASGSGYGSLAMYSRPFWSPIVAGALFTISVFALSWYLMLGCHVGISESGMLAMGGGAAVWIFVTSCIAFFGGGRIIARMSYPSSVFKGAVMWGLALPLGLVIYAIAAHSQGLLGDLTLPHVILADNFNEGLMGTLPHYGFFWATFLTLAAGLFFAMAGSSGCSHAKEDKQSSSATAIPPQPH